VSVSLAKRACLDILVRTTAREGIIDAHNTYSANVDAIAALYGSTGNDAAIAKRVNTTINIFCPDPLFEGWISTAGPSGDVVLAAKKRDSSTASSPLSVLNIYRDVLPTVFGGHSQHRFGYPVINVYYGDDNRLHADWNSTYTHTVYQVGSLTMNHAHYSNHWMLYDPPGRSTPAYWCMSKFSSLDQFTLTFENVNGVQPYTFSPQNINNAQLTGDFIPTY
jgi:hypothetical protein